MSAIRICLQDPALRTAGLIIGLQGAIFCGYAPYFSTLAVNNYGFGDRGYAVLLVLSSLVAVSASIWVGIRADQTANRRQVTLFAVIAVTLGMGLMTFTPSPWVFAIVSAVLIPIGGSIFSQVFALAGLAATSYPEVERDGILSVIRAVFAASFALTLPLWAFAFGQGVPVTVVFPVGLVLSVALLVIVLRDWPNDSQARWNDQPSGLSFSVALAELVQPRTALRVLALGTVMAVGTIYFAIISLVMVPENGRGPEDVALYVGLVAGLEVPFMLILSRLTRGMDRTALILAGALIYGVHVALLPVLVSSWSVWLLVLPAGIGAALILTVPIAYMQDLLAERPGAGASLMSLQKLMGDAIAALCFTLGTLVAGYGTVAILGVIVSVVGAGLLWWADRSAR